MFASPCACVALAALLLLALPGPASALLYCAAGSFGASSASCTPCAGATFSYGGPSACSSCNLASESFQGPALGCTPTAAYNGVTNATALYLSGSAAEGVGAYIATSPGGLASTATDHLGVANGALSVALGSFLTTEPLPQVPTGLGARTLSAWVMCPAPVSATGRTIIDLFDGTMGAANEHFSLLGLATTAPASIAIPQYTNGALAGSYSSGYAEGVGTNAKFNNNQGVCTSSSATNNGLIYVVDSSNYRLRSVNLTSGNTTWLAGTGVAGTGTIVNGAPFSATFAADSSCVVDALQQNVYIGGSGDQAIRVYNIATGIVSTLAGSATRVAGFADGTGSSASFSSPKGVAIDDSNNVYVGDTTANKIRMITPAGVVTTLAGCASQTAPCPASGADGVGSNAGFDAPRGLTIDPTNTYLLVCDYTGDKIRQITIATGNVTTIAGTFTATTFANGIGTSATFSSPTGLTFDSNGAIFVGDDAHFRIRKIVPPYNMVLTISGSGAAPTTALASANNGVGLLANVNPTYMTQANGVIYYGDFDLDTVRSVSAPAAFVYGMAAPVCDGARFHHVAATYDGNGNFSLYVDGVSVANATTQQQVYTAAGMSAAVAIGGSATATENFAGSISDVRIYASALSPAQVLALSQPPLPIFANATMTPAVLTAGVTSYSWSCSPGFSSLGSTNSVSMSLNTATNTWSALTAGTFVCAQVVVCGPGMQVSAGALVCSACPSGLTSPGGPGVVCSPCSAGSYASSSTVCSPCQAGTFSAAGAGSCSACAPGSISAGGGASCTLCGAGLYSVAATSCASCAIGTFSASSGSATCSSCPAGSVAISSGQTNCTLCAAGQYSSSTSTCSACSAGTFSGTGAGTCTTCPAGRVAASTGSLFCTPCPGGQSTAGSTSSCTSCLPGFYAAQGSSSCSACPAGSSSAAGAIWCVPCAAGTTFVAAGDTCAACSGGSSFSYGSAALACSTCASGASFVSALQGCLPSPAVSGSSAVPAPVFYFSGAQSEGVAAFAATAAAGVSTFVSDRLNSASSALSVTLGSYLTTAPLAAVPSGFAARTVTAVVKCAAPLTATGRTLLDFFDGSSNSVTERFTLFGLAGSGSASITVPTYTASTVAGTGKAVSGAGATDGVASSAIFDNPEGVCSSPLLPAYLFTAGNSDNRVRMISPQGVVSTLAGSGTVGAVNGVGTSAQFSSPVACVVDNAGAYVYIAGNADQSIRAVNIATGATTTFAGTPGTVGYADGQSTNSGFNAPKGIAIDLAGNIYVSDYNNNRIRAITPSGAVSTLAGCNTQTAACAAGSTDGIGTAAAFNGPKGLAVDPSGRFLYVADYTALTIRRIQISTQTVTTVAGSFLNSTFANGIGTSATFSKVTGLAFDLSGALLVGDDGHNRIRRVFVTTTGMVQTISGSGSSPSASNLAGNDGAGLTALLNPQMLTVDANNTAFFADFTTSTIRKLTAPASYAVALKAPVCDSKFHHVAATYDGQGNLGLFVDGVQSLTLSTGLMVYTAAGGTAAVGIGGTSIAAEGLAGSISDVRVFSSVLTLSQIMAIAAPPVPSYANAVVTPAVPTAGATVYVWSCLAGSAGPSVSLSRSSVDYSWSMSGAVNCVTCAAASWSGPGQATCTACVAGGLNQSTGNTGPYICNAPTNTATSSATATSTSSSTNSATSSATATGTASGTATATGTATLTASPTSSPSQTPSPTSVPDILLTYSFSIVPSGLVATGLSLATAAVSMQVTSAIDSAFTTLLTGPLLTVSAMNVRVTNVSDLATGAMSLPVSGRRLGASTPLPGSGGFHFTVVIGLGKTPTETAVLAMQSTLAAQTPSSAVFTNIIATLGQLSGLSAVALTAVPGPLATLVNAPFNIVVASTTTSTSSASTAGVAGAAGGGAAGAIIVVLIVTWLAYSYSKHGALPCCRDYAREKREAWEAKLRAEEAAEIMEVVAKGVANPMSQGQGGGKAGAGAIRALVSEKDAQARELLALKALLADQAQRSAGKELAIRVVVPAKKRADFEPQKK